MNSTHRRYLNNLLHFQSSLQFGYKKHILRSDNSLTLHPSNFIIHSEFSEYIPVCFLTSDMFDIDIRTGEFKKEFIIPLIYNRVNRSTGELLNRIREPSRRQGRIEMDSRTHSSSFYFNQGFIMDDKSIVFCAAIKTDYLKQIFFDVYGSLRDNKFFQLMMDNDLQDADDVKNLIQTRLRYHLNDIDIEQANDQMVVFCDPDRMKSVCTLHVDNYESVFGKNSPWAEFRYISDTIGDWFNSKIFTVPDLPSFPSLDGPEEYLIEKLHEEVEQDTDSEYATDGSPSHSLNVEGDTSYNDTWTTVDSGTALNI